MIKKLLASLFAGSICLASLVSILHARALGSTPYSGYLPITFSAEWDGARLAYGPGLVGSVGSLAGGEFDNTDADHCIAVTLIPVTAPRGWRPLGGSQPTRAQAALQDGGYPKKVIAMHAHDHSEFVTYDTTNVPSGDYYVEVAVVEGTRTDIYWFTVYVPGLQDCSDRNQATAVAAPGSTESWWLNHQ